MLRNRTARALTASIIGSSLLLAGCASTSDSGGDESTSNEKVSTKDLGIANEDLPDLAAVDAYVEKLYKGTYEAPPVTPIESAKDKNVWIIAVGLSGCSQCSLQAEAVEEASKLLGWSTKTVNANFSSAEALEGIGQAITAKADAVVLLDIACDSVKSGVVRARAAKIKVVGVESPDCSPGLEDYTTQYRDLGTGEYVDISSWLNSYTAASILWSVSKSKGNANEIFFRQTDSPPAQTQIETAIKNCEKLSWGCKVSEIVDFTAADLGGALQSKTRAALLANPEANTTIVPYDGVMLSGVTTAVRAADRLDTFFVMGAEGNEANINVIRNKDGQDAGVGIPPTWEGYAAVDALNRLFQGKKPEPTGIGIQIFDRDHNLPASGGFDVPSIPYVDVYKKAWGIS